METFIGHMGNDKNLIRTLRIINPDDDFNMMDQVILEQIPAYTYNDQVQRNHTSILQNGHNIYFFRREKYHKDETKQVMQLYKYNLMEKKRQVERTKKLNQELENMSEQKREAYRILHDEKEKVRYLTRV